MIGVDLIGQIRRAYFEQQRSIKEIVRTLLVSLATVRKVIRSHKMSSSTPGSPAHAEAWRLGRGSDGDHREGSQAAEAGAPLDPTLVRGTSWARI
jgi:hypothetical protein